MKEPTQRNMFIVNFCHLSGHFSEANTSEKSVEIFRGRLNTCSKADVISAEKKEDHARTLITGTKSSPTYAMMNVNVLAASS